jgi:hypothetical protein
VNFQLEFSAGNIDTAKYCARVSIAASLEVRGSWEVDIPDGLNFSPYLKHQPYLFLHYRMRPSMLPGCRLHPSRSVQFVPPITFAGDLNDFTDLYWSSSGYFQLLISSRVKSFSVLADAKTRTRFVPPPLPQRSSCPKVLENDHHGISTCTSARLNNALERSDEVCTDSPCMKR